MVVKLNGIEHVKVINYFPKKYENMIVSHKYDIGESEYYDYDYEETYGEMPCADVFVRNFQLKSFDFQESNDLTLPV